MSSFLGWKTSDTNDQSSNSTESNDQNLLNIAIGTAGVDSHLSLSNEHSPVISGKKQNNDQQDGSDYILDSDECGSDTSPRSDKVDEGFKPLSSKMIETSDNKAARIQYNTKIRKRCDKTLTKVSSTGNLRVYHKTDLKNKINAVEHRLLMIEKRLQYIEKNNNNNNVQYGSDYSIPTIIKMVGGCLILLHLGRMI